MIKAGFAILCLAVSALPAGAAPIAISGSVTGPEGEAVAGARVRLLPQPGVWAQGLAAFRGEGDPPAVAQGTVDAAGRFRLEAPRVGLWTVVAEAPGRVPVELRRLSLTDPVELDPAILIEDVGARFRVFGADGRPVANALVILEDDSSFWRLLGGHWHPRRRSGRAGAGGALTLPCGRGEVLTARAVGDGAATGEVSGVTGGRIVLGGGVRREIEVRGADGKPAPEVAVFLPDIAVPAAVTGTNGRFSVAIPAGGSVVFRLAARDGARGAGRTAVTDSGPLVTRMSGLVLSTGRVLSAADRRPLAGALVWADSDPGTLVRTDTAGRYAIRRSVDDRFLLWAAAAGHQDLPWRTGRAQPRGPALALEPALAVTGQIVDAQGVPVAGARIRAVLPERPHSPSFRMTRYGQRAVAGADGGFRLGGLSRGQAYRIEAVAPGFGPIRVDLPPLIGDRRLVLSLSAGRAASGRVVDWAGKPVAEAEILLIDSPGRLPLSREGTDGEPGLNVWRAVTDADGRFHLDGLPPGPFTLRVQHAGFAPLGVRGVAPTDGDLGSWALEPGAVLPGPSRDRPTAAGARVAGRVVDENGMPLFGASLRLTLSDRQRAFASADRDGRFLLDGLQPGHASLEIGAAGFAVVTLPVDLAVEHPIEEMTVVLRNPAFAEGQVLGKGGTPVRDIRVNAGGFDGTVSDADGFWRLDGLAPGRATLSFAKLEGLPLRREIQAKPGLNHLDVTLPDGREVSGTVRDAAGQAVPGALVTLFTGGSYPTFEGLSGEDGTFRITVETDASYDLLTQKEGWADTRRSGLAVEGMPLKGLDVRMGPGAALAGRLLGLADTRDLAEVEIVAYPKERNPIAGRVDAHGRYEVADLAPGEWTVEVRVRGERWGEKTVTIRPADVGTVVLVDLLPSVLSETKADTGGDRARSREKPKPPQRQAEPEPREQGLILEPVLSSGKRPASITAVLSERGSDRTLLLTKAVAADGLARFSEVTHGEWSLLVSAPGGALTAVRSVTVGRSSLPVHVELPVAGRLIVRMPRGRSESATLTLTGPGGHAHSWLGPVNGLQNVFPVIDGTAVAEGVPAGEWEVAVTASDGRILLKTHLKTTGSDEALVLSRDGSP
jgi:protocatechuate 3,4-dioxygenase beta subunit